MGYNGWSLWSIPIIIAKDRGGLNKRRIYMATDFMTLKKWVVCGNVTDESKYAYKILKQLKEKGFEAEGYHPKSDGSEVANKLEDLSFAPDVIDLVVNPVTGLEALKAAKAAGIRYVMAQPGARSEEIAQFCRDNGMEYQESCALVEMSKL